MPISNEELKKIAQLSKLDIDDSELEKFKEQFEKILDFVSQLKEVDVSDIDSTDVGHINDEINNWRDDTVHECDEKTKEAILDEVPETKDRFVKVPGVFYT